MKKPRYYAELKIRARKLMADSCNLEAFALKYQDMALAARMQGFRADIAKMQEDIDAELEKAQEQPTE